jgi:hypothetical protein
MERLEPFSKRYAQAIFAVYPEWKLFATEELRGEEDVLRIEVPSPLGQQNCTLTLGTWNGEITVYFNEFHSHFSSFSEGDEWDQALPFINALLDEQIAIASYWRDGKHLGSSCFKIDTPDPGASSFRRANQVRVRSWRGTYNKDSAI